MLSLKRNVNCPRRMAVYAVFDVLDRMGCQYEQALVGDIMGDLNKRRASVLGMHPHESKTGFTTVEASAPKSELADYPIALRAMTQGRGWFDYTVTGYDTVPANVAAKVIAALQTK